MGLSRDNEGDTMRVFELCADHSRYQYVTTEPENVPHERLCPPFAQPMAATWEPVRIRMQHKDRGKRLVPCDYPALAPGNPLFSRRAVDALRDILEANGEILPLLCDEGEYFLYNVTRVIDALDLERCEVARFSDGSLHRIITHAFKPERVRDAVIFKIPTFRFSDVFVTDCFVTRVEQARLTGMEFGPLWSSAPGFDRS